MNERTHDRLFAGCGIAFVVLDLVGAIIAMAAGKTHNLTISSTPAQIAHAVAKPAGTAVWIGAYLEFLSVGAFLAFAVWACAKLGGGLLGATARAAATGYAAVTIVSLAVMAAIAYRAGHGMGVQLATALVTVERGPLRLHVVPERLLPARCRRACAERRCGGRSDGARSASLCSR